MTRYWAMRTDRNRTERLWEEVRVGRLRQGWGYHPDQDLNIIAAAIDRHEPLARQQRDAWRNRPMLTTRSGGVQVGDVLILPHLPKTGEVSMVKVIGDYRFQIVEIRNADWDGQDYGHILPVAVLRAAVPRTDASISDALRRGLRPRIRMWNLDRLASEIESMIGA